MEFLLVTSMVVGIVEFVKRVFDADYKAATIIACAALTGAMAGVFGVEGIDVATGLVVGLAGSGLVTIVSRK